MEYNVDEEVHRLIKISERLCGGPTGSYTFKQIFYDKEAEGAFESLAGTLKAAKRRGVISYDSPILLQGAHDAVVITFHGAK